MEDRHMESEKLNGFVVHIYSPGNQIIQTQNNNYYGTVYQTKNENGQNGFSDEQVAKALQACVGKDKVINLGLIGASDGNVSILLTLKNSVIR